MLGFGAAFTTAARWGEDKPMSLYCTVGAPDADLSADQLKNLLVTSLEKLGPRKRVLAVPPDMTRLH